MIQNVQIISSYTGDCVAYYIASDLINVICSELDIYLNIRFNITLLDFYNNVNKLVYKKYTKQINMIMYDAPNYTFDSKEIAIHNDKFVNTYCNFNNIQTKQNDNLKLSLGKLRKYWN